MGDEDCIFCRIAAGQIPAAKIYEDELVAAFLDINPVSEGHSLVVPKRHFEQVGDCPAELFGQIAGRLGRIAEAIMAAMKAEGYNLLCNNGLAAGQLVNHMHFHIIPRKNGDGVFDRWPAYKYPQGRIEVIAQKIKESLQTIA